jgi:hypothetical protein
VGGSPGRGESATVSPSLKQLWANTQLTASGIWGARVIAEMEKYNHQVGLEIVSEMSPPASPAAPAERRVNRAQTHCRKSERRVARRRHRPVWLAYSAGSYSWAEWWPLIKCVCSCDPIGIMILGRGEFEVEHLLS